MKKVYGLLVLLSLGGLLQATDYGVSIADLLKAKKIPQISDKKLNLSNSQITSLEGLKDIPNIEKVQMLDLSHNKISIISTDLARLKNLEVLLLIGNNIEVIPNDAFSGMEKLLFLDLAHNKIKEISTSVFEGLNLDFLIIFGNELTPETKEKLIEKFGEHLSI